jgi:hypothetical protein
MEYASSDDCVSPLTLNIHYYNNDHPRANLIVAIQWWSTLLGSIFAIFWRLSVAGLSHIAGTTAITVHHDDDSFFGR